MIGLYFINLEKQILQRECQRGGKSQNLGRENQWKWRDRKRCLHEVMESFLLLRYSKREVCNNKREKENRVDNKKRERERLGEREK